MWVLLGNPSRPPRSKGDLPPLLLRLTNLFGYLFLILVNVLSSVGALGGTNAQVSAKFPTPLTPAGWAFAIWGVIFALEGLGVVYQIMNSGYREGGWKASIIIKIGYGWQAGWLFQDLWQFAFVRENVPSMWLAAFALLAALLAFQWTLHRLSGTTQELRARGYAGMPALAYAFYKLPTAINAAWLSVAAALGILIVPVSHGVSQAKLVAPAAVLTVVVSSGAVWRLLRHRDVAYGFTLIWALLAVATNSSGNVPRTVKIVGIVCLVVIALCVVSALVRTHRAHSSTAAAAAGVDGSLLNDSYNSPYAMYGDQRTLLSDPDAPAGFQRESSSGSFTFPSLHPPTPVNNTLNGVGAFASRPSSEGMTVAVALGVGVGGKVKQVTPAQLPMGTTAAGVGGGLTPGKGDGEGSIRLSAGAVNDVTAGCVGTGSGAASGMNGSGSCESVARDGGAEGLPLGAVPTGRRVRFQDEEAPDERH